MSLGKTGALVISAFGDGELLLDSYRVVVTQGFSHQFAIPWVSRADDPALLHVDAVTEHPEMPDWLTGRVGLRPGYNASHFTRPFVVYGRMAEHWSSIVHFPIHGDRVQESRRGPVPLPSVMSFAFRAEFDDA